MTRPFDCDVAGLFEGYGGLTMATRSVLGGDLGWYSEIEPAACRVLAHHHPGVPNLGDITKVDWDEAPRPRVVTGGFPCTDVSSAGLQLGLRPGTRSGLWSHMRHGIDRLRPELVVIENVRGLLSAGADCDLEPCPWCLGDHEDRPLRALGAVLGDLAGLGYDANWCGLRAADVGAPHGRFRIFITAWPAADSGGGELQRRRVGGVLAGAQGPGGGEGPERERHRDAAGDGGEDAADADGSGLEDGWRQSISDGGCAAERSGCLVADAEGERRQRRRRSVGPAADSGRRSDHQNGPAAADAVRDGREGSPKRDQRTEAEQPAPLGRDAAGRVLDWGDYAPAIRRWGLKLGRPAPAPTMTGKRGGQQLSPAFVEWLMGLPEGHVTAVPGVSRNEALKLLGNGVVPKQAEAALLYLLNADRERCAA